ncbi:MAG: haloalkane dehalogenase [Alphaproteobacteria bacterium]|nr:haloalkane dehalogenase [Alphaproteobacteria bacterium]
MAKVDISATCPYEPKRVDVLDTHMAYLEAGTGDPIVFLHGNPTRAFLWRNVIPHVETLGRCLAPDLVGMGDSGPMPSGTYRYAEHIDYLDAWFDAVDVGENAILVVHDWGAALGFNRIAEHAQDFAGLAYMEAMVRPRKWADLPQDRAAQFKAFRTAEGAAPVLEGNLFVEKLLFEQGVIRALTQEEKAVYRAPYPDPESRRLTLVFSQEIPFDGEPADNHAIVQRYADHLAASDMPKLFINTTEGHALLGGPRDFCRTWKNQTEITVTGRHYAQEDSPHEIGEALAAFVSGIRT